MSIIYKFFADNEGRVFQAEQGSDQESQFLANPNLIDITALAQTTSDDGTANETPVQVSNIVGLDPTATTGETLTTLTVSGNILTYTNEDGVAANIDLSIYLDDTNAARISSGILNSTSGIVTFTRDDATTFTVDFSALNDQAAINTAISAHESATNPHTQYQTMSDVEIQVNSHANRADNPHNVTAPQVGLGSVDNTSDVDKPVSTAQQTALDELQSDIDTLNTTTTSLQTQVTSNDTDISAIQTEQITQNTDITDNANAIALETANRISGDNALQANLDTHEVTIDSHDDVDVTTITPTTMHHLGYNGTNWVPTRQKQFTQLSGRFETDADGDWASWSDVNFGPSLQDWDLDLGNGVEPIIDWDGLGLAFPQGATLRRIFVKFRGNNNDLNSIEFFARMHDVDLTTGAAIDTAGEIGAVTVVPVTAVSTDPGPANSLDFQAVNLPLPTPYTTLNDGADLHLSCRAQPGTLSANRQVRVTIFIEWELP